MRLPLLRRLSWVWISTTLLAWLAVPHSLPAQAPLPTTPGTANPAEVTAARRSIEANYRKMAVATEKKDARALLSLMTPDYETLNPEGERRTLAQIRAQTEKLFRVAEVVRANFVIKSFTLKGDEAIVTVKGHAEASTTDPNNGDIVASVSDGLAEDTWGRSGKGWLMKRSRMLTQKDSTIRQPGGE
jgi:ketosteroid isomerase-like protein